MTNKKLKDTLQHFVRENFFKRGSGFGLKLQDSSSCGVMLPQGIHQVTSWKSCKFNHRTCPELTELHINIHHQTPCCPPSQPEAGHSSLNLHQHDHGLTWMMLEEHHQDTSHLLKQMELK